MLQLKEVHKTFNRGTVNENYALRGVSLEVEDRSFVIILGGNGSGKSTTLNAVSGTFPIDSGSITIDSTTVSRWPEHKRARFIGRVFQNPFSGTAPDMSIAENFALASHRGRRRGLGLILPRRLRQEMRERIAGLKMGLENQLNTPIGSLSGGQRQALTLLMAAWNRPNLLLLDEHTAALDPKSADQVIQLTRELVEKDRLTTLMVTHSMQQAVNLGDRLIVMHQGQVLLDFKGRDKERLKVDQLLEIFEDIRRRDLLDEGAAAMLQRAYV